MVQVNWAVYKEYIVCNAMKMYGREFYAFEMEWPGSNMVTLKTSVGLTM